MITYKCPKCGGTELRALMMVNAEIVQGETGRNGAPLNPYLRCIDGDLTADMDAVWDAKVLCNDHECEHEGPLSQFEHDDQEQVA